jgi:sugar diacid utilization regulator
MPKVTIVRSAAVELLQRLTESLEVPLTLTDADGSVVASTAGRPAGQVDMYAAMSARQGKTLEFGEEELSVPEGIAVVSPAAEHTGLLPLAPGVYVPVRINEQIGAVLFARGEPGDVRLKAVTAAASAGLALEFASGATQSMQQTLGPDLALRALLRGTKNEARKATLLVRVAGWELLVPRAALVVIPAALRDHLPEATNAVLRELLAALVPNTPSGQLDATELAALPPLPRLESQPPIDRVAAEIESNLRDQGLPVIIGIGETHIDLPILPGLRRSYREAQFAAHWARKLGATSGSHALRSLGPLAFLAPGVRQREKLAQQTLEPLQQFPDVLATVRAFLDSDLSLETTARVTGQHRHTVRSHLQRAREVTGLDPRVLSDALQLKLALMLGTVQTV